MFKRLTWMGVGLVAGLGASKWVERKARRRLARYLPGGRLALGAGAEARDWAREVASATLADLRHAVDEGRRTMEERQVELRRQLRLPEPDENAGPDLRTARASLSPVAPTASRARAMTTEAPQAGAPGHHRRSSRSGRAGEELPAS